MRTPDKHSHTIEQLLSLGTLAPARKRWQEDHTGLHNGTKEILLKHKSPLFVSLRRQEAFPLHETLRCACCACMKVTCIIDITANILCSVLLLFYGLRGPPATAFCYLICSTMYCLCNPLHYTVNQRTSSWEHVLCNEPTPHSRRSTSTTSSPQRN